MTSDGPLAAPTAEQLRLADCDFPADRVADPLMRAFKQRTRLAQHQWALSQGITTFGTHRNSAQRIAAGGTALVANGTKLTDADAEAGRNFLSEDIRRAVAGRIAAPQKGETLDEVRLRRDLLSSMPMAFNLFGEARYEGASRQALARLLAPGVPGDVEVTFEWSPGRRDATYTRDRTAFDVALLIGPADDIRTAVGIETKYHEHAVRETKPSAAAKPRYDAQTRFLTGLADASGVFVPGWKAAVLETDLRQIWRDHLLALSMRAHTDRWTAQCRYVLVYPRANVSFADSARRYAELVAPDDTSFAHIAIEDLLDAAFAHGGPTKAAFRARYLS